MNSLLWVAIIVSWLIIGYKVYGKFIERRLVEPDDTKPTPAHSNYDGGDYSPARIPLLFGHHFSSIAGAGPIVGPLLGVMYFGWLLSSLWIAFGSVFIGAVHDYLALMTSVRNNGRSISQTAQQTLGTLSKSIFATFLWLALVLVVAVFAVITAKTFIAQPEIVIPTFGLILVAILFGYTIYRLKWPILIGTVLALSLLALLLYIGENVPVILPETVVGMSALNFWFCILMLYCVFASTIPVWILLQPRDYISSWLLYIGMGLGFLGLIVLHPHMEAPAVVSFSSKEGPMWPMMFVIIACGAVSGFHSLVSGGTSSKQLDRERQGLVIGYGAMITEAILATLVIAVAAGALIWDPSAVKSEFGYQYLMGAGGGPIVAFSHGFGKIVSSLPVLTLVAGMYIGMLMLNAFVITTLDTATRLARFIFVESLGEKFKLFGNKYVVTVITVLVAAFLGTSGGYKTIWPVFGAANQLVAALALIVISAYLVGIKKPRIYTVIPAFFMIATTIGALVYKMIGFVQKGNIVLAILSILLIGLGLFVIYEARAVLLFMKDGRNPAGDKSL
ncbi:MAG: carbon starvation protein A [Candidatus Zixiibacteriota bacterium]|nr:MAG: carbon starvation protein A [candidate division Zixibacteria bacterium]